MAPKRTSKATRLDDVPLPLKPPADYAPSSSRGRDRPTLAPAWVALLTAWLGLVILVASVVFVFLPGSRDPRAELTHRRPYSAADRFLPVPIYGIAVTLFVGIVVLWQMRKEPRPLPEALVRQRVQAWVGIVLALMGAVVIYTYVGLHGLR